MVYRENCALCDNTQTSQIYYSENMPVFQNKVYPNKELASQVMTSNITLRLCELCGFVFNSTFDATEMHYDTHYENEQAHSVFFQDYLASIIKLFTEHSFHKKKIIEIGCGKGFFLELLVKNGFNVTGFDPAYTGSNPAIVKDYFSDDYNELAAEVIILRHVLEHIEQPLDFLHTIAAAVNYNASIYIEVPTLDWIIQNNAFWDIFHEHCNYFTFKSIGGLFEDAKQGLLFNGQYMYLLADLKKLRKKNINHQHDNTGSNLSNFKQLITQYRNVLAKNPGMIVWGAGAKGVTFANLIDPEANLISCLVDINPKKQQHYIAKTAHKIISPEMLAQQTKGSTILVMNENYLDEIKKLVSSTQFNVIGLNDLGIQENIN